MVQQENNMTTQEEENDVIYLRKEITKKNRFNGLTITSKEKWCMRLWYFMSNPFRYLFTGKIKY